MVYHQHALGPRLGVQVKGAWFGLEMKSLKSPEEDVYLLLFGFAWTSGSVPSLAWSSSSFVPDPGVAVGRPVGVWGLQLFLLLGVGVLGFKPFVFGWCGKHGLQRSHVCVLQNMVASP